MKINNFSIKQFKVKDVVTDLVSRKNGSIISLNVNCNNKCNLYFLPTWLINPSNLCFSDLIFNIIYYLSLLKCIHSRLYLSPESCFLSIAYTHTHTPLQINIYLSHYLCTYLCRKLLLIFEKLFLYSSHSQKSLLSSFILSNFYFVLLRSFSYQVDWIAAKSVSYFHYQNQTLQECSSSTEPVYCVSYIIRWIR